jgi:hypothetical protein
MTYKDDYFRRHEDAVDRFEQLAASQAREAALREALEKIADTYGAWGPFPEKNAQWRAMAVTTSREALSAPHDTTALDRACKLYAAEVLRELCKFAFTHQCNFDLWLLDKAEQLRKEAS